jgi:hypothetical protein
MVVSCRCKNGSGTLKPEAANASFDLYGRKEYYSKRLQGHLPSVGGVMDNCVILWEVNMFVSCFVDRVSGVRLLSGH